MDPSSERLRIFVACAPGLEPLLRDELRDLGVKDPTPTPGGVSCFGDLATVYRINLGSGLGLRVLVRIAEFFVRDFRKLERVAGALAWEQWLAAERGVRVRAHSKRSRLYHTGAIAERVERGIEKRSKGKIRLRADAEASGPGGGDIEGQPGAEPTLVQVRIVRDRCTVSVDTTGVLLHKRGWRLQTGKAPLREDIARALLTVSGWRPGMSLFDPMAGAGTIVIEAATMAAGIPPGARRSFSFMSMPGYSSERFEGSRGGLHCEARGPDSRFLGRDRSPGAVDAARANAERAGLAARVDFEVGSLGDPNLPALPSELGVALISNPPWGKRTGDPGRLRNLYATFGKHAHALAQAHRQVTVGLIAADPALVGATGLGLRPALSTEQGGVRLSLWTGSLAHPEVDGNIAKTNPGYEKRR